MSSAVTATVIRAPSRSPTAILVRKLFGRKLVLAGYPAIKRVDGRNQVLVGELTSFCIAVTIMVSINATITLVIFLPLVITIMSSYLAWARIRVAWLTSRSWRNMASAAARNAGKG